MFTQNMHTYEKALVCLEIRPHLPLWIKKRPFKPRYNVETPYNLGVKKINRNKQLVPIRKFISCLQI